MDGALWGDDGAEVEGVGAFELDGRAFEPGDGRLAVDGTRITYAMSRLLGSSYRVWVLRTRLKPKRLQK